MGAVLICQVEERPLKFEEPKSKPLIYWPFSVPLLFVAKFLDVSLSSDVQVSLILLT